MHTFLIKQKNKKFKKRNSLLKSLFRFLYIIKIRKNYKYKKIIKKSNNSNIFTGIISNLFDFSINHNKKLLLSLILLILIGIMFTFSATISFSYWYSPNKSEFFFLFNHLRILSLGLILSVPLLFINLKFIFRSWPFIYLYSIFLLIYLTYQTFTGQIENIDGATRWINIGTLQFQPSEFIKLALVISLPPIFKLLNNITQNKNLNHKTKLLLLITFNISFILILILILGTKNLGNTIIVGMIGLVGYWYVSKTNLEKINLLILLTLILLGGIIFAVIESYRADRINVWLNYLRTGDTTYQNEEGVWSREGKSYQLDQSLISIGSGGITGKGLGNSIGKYYLPKTSSGDDSIFSVIAEELGFVFTLSILLLFLYLILQLINIAKNLNNIVYSCTLITTATWIGIQTFVHIGANIGILPLTGQTLPFMSTGGSSIISLLLSMALCLNISRYVNYN